MNVSRLQVKKLIEIICTIPDDNDLSIAASFAELKLMLMVKTHARKCCEYEQNPVQALQPTAAPDTTRAYRHHEEIIKIKTEINNIQQSLLVNSLEIIRLPVPNENEDNETLI